jgi:hypothetical protein
MGYHAVGSKLGPNACLAGGPQALLAHDDGHGQQLYPARHRAPRHIRTGPARAPKPKSTHALARTRTHTIPQRTGGRRRVSRSHCAGRGGEHHPRQVREHGRARRYDRRRARRVCRDRRHLLGAAVPLPKGAAPLCVRCASCAWRCRQLLCAASCTFRLVLSAARCLRACLSELSISLVVCGATACCLRHVALPVSHCKWSVARAATRVSIWPIDASGVESAQVWAGDSFTVRPPFGTLIYQ